MQKGLIVGVFPYFHAFNISTWHKRWNYDCSMAYFFTYLPTASDATFQRRIQWEIRNKCLKLQDTGEAASWGRPTWIEKSSMGCSTELLLGYFVTRMYINKKLDYLSTRVTQPSTQSFVAQTRDWLCLSWLCKSLQAQAEWNIRRNKWLPVKLKL